MTHEILIIDLLISISNDDFKAAGYWEELASDINKLVLQRAALARKPVVRGSSVQAWK